LRQTTLLRVIAGFVRQAACRVRVDGAPVTTCRPTAQHRHRLPNYALFPH